MADWKLFHGNCTEENPPGLSEIPDRPPWREFLPLEDVDEEADKAYWKQLQKAAKADKRSIERGRSFQIQKDERGHSDVVDAVNAALHLRRPLLVTGMPGSGKTSLAYAIAHELQLGPVLVWSITARSKLQDALYRYDAIARLQDAQLDKMRKMRREELYEAIARLPEAQINQMRQNAEINESGEEDSLSGYTPQLEREEGSLGEYIQLGAVGTAFLPSRRPRVLLIDEIDKSDLNLPNDLLNLFEEGQFEIPELVRRKRRKRDRQDKDEKDAVVDVRSEDKDMEAIVTNGRVQCCEFPLVVMTSNGEREFPPAFYRRCLRVEMPKPTRESLLPVVQAHFNRGDREEWDIEKVKLDELIKEFLGSGNKGDRATDQLLNAVYLIARKDSPSDAEMKRLKKLLFKRLSEVG